MTLSLGDLDNIFIISVYFLEGLKNLETIFIAYNDLLEYESHKIIDNIAQSIFNINFIFIIRFLEAYMLMQNNFAVTVCILRDIGERNS